MTVRSSGCSSSEAKKQHQRDLAFTLGITLVAAALRGYVAWHFACEPVWDGHYYHFGAQRLAQGLGYSEDVLRLGRLVWKPWTHYPVGYSLWLSLWYRVFGSHVWVALLANATVGTMTVTAVHRLARPLLGTWRARLAAILVALHPGLVLYTAAIMSEPLAAFLLLASLLPIGVWRRAWIGWGLAGLLLGASVLVRPSSLVAIPLYWFFAQGSSRGRLRGLAILTAFCFVAIAPWTLRNCHRMDGCALVSTNGGWNLAIGALTDTGRFRTLRAADGCPVVTGQVQQDRCWMERGLAVIQAEPKRWLGLAPLKLAQTFDHESFVVEYLREANPKAWPEARRVLWRECLTDFHRWLVAVASFSVVSRIVGRRAWQRAAFYVEWGIVALLATLAFACFSSDEHPFHWLVLVPLLVAVLPLPGRPALGGIVGFGLGFVGLTELTHVVFFGDDRYHLVVSPLLCLLAAAALRVESVTERTQRRLRPSSAG